MKAIITFHSIDPGPSVLSFHPDKFLKLIQAMVESHIPICSLQTLLNENVSHGIALTFDDGMHSVFTHAMPIIKDFKIPAHLFLTAGHVGKDNNWPSQPMAAAKFKMMDWRQIEACQAAGISIDAHTWSHPNLTKLTIDELEDELARCDDIIEQRLGRKPKYFAYPYGIHDRRIRDFVKSRYIASVTTYMRPLHNSEDSAALPRLDSYYLQPSWLHNKLANPIGLGYLMSRSLIRTLRGHQ